MWPGAAGRWLLKIMVGFMSRMALSPFANRAVSVLCSQGESTVAQKICPCRNSWSERSVASCGTADRSAPKQSELNNAPDLSSWKPVVAGWSNVGGLIAVRVRSPTVIF